MGREQTSGPFQFESMQNLIDSIKYHSRSSDISLLKIVTTCSAIYMTHCRKPYLIVEQNWVMVE